ncbi:hypothetical protein OEG86_06800 [Hoeflea alexandrii]|uniref:hypothetical protein n=1 Tax=Hoeflea alexandrii TaxID=288436 RepID=UPI00226D856F|nr:hypothetical protein [Hoeflea alexandrii]MCY0152007.1 hypothetical protein [Hoeflea alexandrii]
MQQAEVSAAGHAMQPVSGLENVEAQLAEISARLDRPYVDQAPMMMPGMESLEARLADIADRLDMSSTGQAGPSDEAMRGLEDQIANLSRLISSAPSAAGTEAFDERLASIEEHLATSDEFVVEAARQAAEAALSAYSGQMGSAPSPQSIANMEVITALADDLKALEGLSRKTEDRTTRAFEAVQETMMKIAERLERLGAPAPGLHQGASHDEPASRAAFGTAMPQASAQSLEDVMELAGEHEDALSEMDGSEAEMKPHAARSPSEAAALAAAYAKSQEAEAGDDEMPETGKTGDKSFLSGLAARIRPGRDASKAQAEPQFTENDTPPLDPSMEMDAETANMPLEPGSGAPDINRILQKVREAQAAERQRGGGPADTGSEKTEFLASARRAAMAAAAEVETIGKGRKSGGGGMLEVLKSKRRPILMAAERDPAGHHDRSAGLGPALGRQRGNSQCRASNCRARRNDRSDCLEWRCFRHGGGCRGRTASGRNPLARGPGDRARYRYTLADDRDGAAIDIARGHGGNHTGRAGSAGWATRF